MTDARKQAKRDYDIKNTKSFAIKLNYNTDADLIALLESRDNIQGFIKGLLYEYIAKLSKRNRVVMANKAKEV